MKKTCGNIKIWVFFYVIFAAVFIFSVTGRPAEGVPVQKGLICGFDTESDLKEVKNGIMYGEGSVKVSLFPNGQEGNCMKVDYALVSGSKDEVRVEVWGDWDFNRYQGIEFQIKGGDGQSFEKLHFTHWVDDGDGWIRYKTSEWSEEITPGEWKKCTINFSEPVIIKGGADFDPHHVRMFKFIFEDKDEKDRVSGTIYIDNLRFITKDEIIAKTYSPLVGTWVLHFFDPETGGNDVLNWKLLKEAGIKPLVGYYSSFEPRTILTQIEQMKRAGIDFMVIDTEPRYIESNWVLHLVTRALELQPTGREKMKMCIQLEVYGSAPDPEILNKAANYIYDNFATKDFYVKYKGKPLLLPYTGTGVHSKWDDPRFTTRWLGAEWLYSEGYPQKINKEWMPVSPGTDNKFEQMCSPEIVKFTYFVSRDYGNLYRKMIERVKVYRPDIVFVSSWNDWAFMNQIEPSEDYGYFYVDMTAELLGKKIADKKIEIDENTVNLLEEEKKKLWKKFNVTK